MTTTAASEPRHGATRNRGPRSTPNPPVGFLGPAGELVVVPPISALADLKSERYCGVCRAWVDCTGILEALACKTCTTPWGVELREHNGASIRGAAAAGGAR